MGTRPGSWSSASAAKPLFAPSLPRSWLSQLEPQMLSGHRAGPTAQGRSPSRPWPHFWCPSGQGPGRNALDPPGARCWLPPSFFLALRASFPEEAPAHCAAVHPCWSARPAQALMTATYLEKQAVSVALWRRDLRQLLVRPRHNQRLFFLSFFSYGERKERGRVRERVKQGRKREMEEERERKRGKERNRVKEG